MEPKAALRNSCCVVGLRPRAWLAVNGIVIRVLRGVAMPSWNIHIAQTERLLARAGTLADNVRDRNAFLFGCVVPDIFVGYMVPGIADPIPYRITLFA